MDTAGLTQAKDYIVTFLNDLGWTVEVHKFTQDTVIGEKTFRNIIATRNPNSPRRLVLAAHYDTKISPEVDFFLFDLKWLFYFFTGIYWCN